MIRKLERETWILIKGSEIIDIFNEEDAYNKARTKADLLNVRDVFVAKVFCGDGNIESMKKSFMDPIPRSIRDIDFDIPTMTSWFAPAYPSAQRWLDGRPEDMPIARGWYYYRDGVDPASPPIPIQPMGEGIIQAARSAEYPHQQMTAQAYEGAINAISEYTTPTFDNPDSVLDIF